MGDGGINLCRVDGPLVHAEFLNGVKAQLIVFVGRHSSASQVPSMTVHSLGNFGTQANLGGRPRSLSIASPITMRSILVRMSEFQSAVGKTYEATHHGPLLDIPSAFAELGGSNAAMHDKQAAAIVADAVVGAVKHPAGNPHAKVAIGIGGNHYPSKFTKLAIENGYAFSHIVSKYSLADSIDMLDQAVDRSSPRPEIAVIDWKSINSVTRENVIRRLEGIGIGYERV